MRFLPSARDSYSLNPASRRRSIAAATTARLAARSWSVMGASGPGSPAVSGPASPWAADSAADTSAGGSVTSAGGSVTSVRGEVVSAGGSGRPVRARRSRRASVIRATRSSSCSGVVRIRCTWSQCRWPRSFSASRASMAPCRPPVAALDASALASTEWSYPVSPCPALTAMPSTTAIPTAVWTPATVSWSAAVRRPSGRSRSYSAAWASASRAPAAIVSGSAATS